MGTMKYDGAIIEYEDRLLTHLQIVIMQKLRRGEGFPMSWLDALEVGDGRSSIWLSPSVPIYFKFAGSKVPEINHSWLRTLTESADSSRGLVVTDEHGELARALSKNKRW